MQPLNCDSQEFFKNTIFNRPYGHMDMQPTPNTFSLPVKMRRAALLLGTSLLFLAQRQPPDLVTALPSPQKDQLSRYREKNDLSGWIYSQIQWVARAPVIRADQLVRAAGEAWRNPRGNEEIQAWQDLLINEGWALLLSGDIVHSTDAYTMAFQWARQHKEMVDETQVMENILKPLGNNYTRLGDYEQALFIHQKALAIATSLGDKEAMAGIYSNLANTASNMGEPAQAMDHCREGLKIADPHSALYGLLLSEQADACSALQQFAAARESVQKSIAVLEKQPAVALKKIEYPADAGYWLLMAYQQAGDIYSSQPRIALNYYTRALALQSRLSQENGAIHKREQAKLYQRLGHYYFQTGQPAQAAYWLDRCLSLLIPGKKIDSLQVTDLFGENTLTDLLYDRAELYNEQGSADQALRVYTLCFAAEKKLRNELVTGSSKEESVSDIRFRYEEAIRTAWDAWEKTARNKYRQKILEFMESSKAQLLLEELLQQQRYRTGDSVGNRVRLLERALIYYHKELLQGGGNDSLRQQMIAREKQVTWDLAQLHKRSRDAVGDHPGDTSSFSPDPLQSLLDNGEKVRSFFTGSQAIYTVELNSKGIGFAERLPLSRRWQDSLRGFTQGWFEQGAEKMIDRPAAYYEQAYTIYWQLFGNHPPGKETILLPDGALNLLPVEALVTQAPMPPSPAKWPFVIRESQITYAWSLSTLREQILSPANSGRLSGFFLSGNIRELPWLQATAKEEQAMSRIIKEGDWYMDGEATTMAFRKALQSSAIVHISSHASTAKTLLDAPHIELCNEPFYLFELKDLDRHPALVVLSACRTGNGRMVTGEGAQSLARAFTAGGTNAVIAGWWNVNDAVAAQLLQRFYTTLVNSAGKPFAPDATEALRRAKTGWLDDPQTPYLQKLPYYWASMNYQGNPDPLQAGEGLKGKSPTVWHLLIGMIGLSVLFLLYRRLR